MEQEEYKGYKVYFDEHTDCWVAYDNNHDLIAKNVSRLKLLETLDNISKKKFERFDVLDGYHSQYELCTVTSIVPTGAWLTVKESSGYHKKGHREKMSSYGISSLKPVTKHNLETVEKIRELRKNIGSIELAISKLEHGMNEMPSSMIEKFNKCLSGDNQIKPNE
jgi:hypothetical protein